MQPEDVTVWERFVQNNPRFLDTCDYDLAVGEGAPQNPEHPENIQADGKILTQKKIDVVGYQNDLVYLIEVKPIANARALGQILTYKNLYSRDHTEVSNPIPMVVCGAVEREMDEMFEKNGIMVEVA